MLLKNLIVLVSMLVLCAALSAYGTAAADRAFPPFPSSFPAPFPALPTPFPHPFPTVTPVTSPTIAPTTTPSPTPTPTATNIYGFVKDKSGAVLPGIYAVVLNRSGTGASYSSTSDTDGYYMVCHVPFGNYSIAYIRDNTTAYTRDIVLNRSTQKMNATLP